MTSTTSFRYFCSLPKQENCRLNITDLIILDWFIRDEREIGNNGSRQLGKQSWISLSMHWLLCWSWKSLEVSVFGLWIWWRCFSYTIFHYVVPCWNTTTLHGAEYRTYHSKRSRSFNQGTLSLFQRYLHAFKILYNFFITWK